MLTQEKSKLQALAPQSWDKPTAQASVGDYIREPFQPIMVVVDKDLLPDGKIWMLVKPVSASRREQWILEAEAAQPSTVAVSQLENARVEQPATSQPPSCELQPSWSAIEEYEKGKSHGEFDAAARIKPICTGATCAFSTGYVDGYNRFTIANEQFTQLPKPKKTMEWRVVYAPDWDWDWYVLWVEGKCIGKYSSCEAAQSAAQRYIAADVARLEHRELVLAAFAG